MQRLWRQTKSHRLVDKAKSAILTLTLDAAIAPQIRSLVCNAFWQFKSSPVTSSYQQALLNSCPLICASGSRSFRYELRYVDPTPAFVVNGRR
jgi:hypothetical protein